MPKSKYTEDAVRVMLRSSAEAHGGQRALARKIGVSVAFVNQIILGNRPPSGKPLEHLKLRRVVTYESL